MKSDKSLLENKQNGISGYFVRHTSCGLFVGKRTPQAHHWYLYVKAEDAERFNSQIEAENFINQRPYWLQEYLEVVKVYIDCTQDEEHIEVVRV